MTEQERQVRERITELHARLHNLKWVKNHTHYQIAQLYADLDRMRREEEADPA